MSGYQYTDDKGNEMVEYHVDSHETFKKRMNIDTPFGGILSVHKDPSTKPLVIFGHDK